MTRFVKSITGFFNLCRPGNNTSGITLITLQVKTVAVPTVHHAEDHEDHPRLHTVSKIPIAQNICQCQEQHGTCDITQEFWFFFFISTLAQTGFPCVALAVMELALQSRLASNLGPCTIALLQGFTLSKSSRAFIHSRVQMAIQKAKTQLEKHQ